MIDFYKRLIIEIDGLIHNTEERIEYDRIRNEILKSNNHNILRFTNHEIKTDIDNVINEIKDINLKITNKSVLP